MKIWIDILTPKQVLFFNGVGEELTKRGYEVFITLRSYRETIGLAEMYLYNKFHIKIFGKYEGETLEERLSASIKRSLELAEYISEMKPDIAISSTSPDAARVAYGLGVSHISVSDMPQAEAVSRLTVPLSKKLYCPWIISKRKWLKYGIASNQVIQYKGLDPVVWIKRHKEDEELISKYNLRKRKYIVVRTVEKKASYQLPIISKKKINMKKWINNFQEISGYNYTIFILPRYEDQIEKLKLEYVGEDSVVIIDKVIDGLTLLKYASGFIGYGGTMTMEAALLGKPTISLRQGNPPECHSYLVKKNLVKHMKNGENIAETLLKLIKHRDVVERIAEKIYSKMRDPAETIAETIGK